MLSLSKQVTMRSRISSLSIICTIILASNQAVRSLDVSPPRLSMLSKGPSTSADPIDTLGGFPKYKFDFEASSSNYQAPTVPNAFRSEKLSVQELVQLEEEKKSKLKDKKKQTITSSTRDKEVTVSEDVVANYKSSRGGSIDISKDQISTDSQSSVSNIKPNFQARRAFVTDKFDKVKNEISAKSQSVPNLSIPKTNIPNIPLSVPTSVPNIPGVDSLGSIAVDNALYIAPALVTTLLAIRSDKVRKERIAAEKAAAEAKKKQSLQLFNVTLDTKAITDSGLSLFQNSSVAVTEAFGKIKDNVDVDGIKNSIATKSSEATKSAQEIVSKVQKDAVKQLANSGVDIDEETFGKTVGALGAVTVSLGLLNVGSSVTPPESRSVGKSTVSQTVAKVEDTKPEVIKPEVTKPENKVEVVPEVKEVKKENISESKLDKVPTIERKKSATENKSQVVSTSADSSTADSISTIISGIDVKSIPIAQIGVPFVGLVALRSALVSSKNERENQGIKKINVENIDDAVKRARDAASEVEDVVKRAKAALGEDIVENPITEETNEKSDDS